MNTFPTLIIFAAGNKYKTYQGQKPNLVHGSYYTFAFKWIKSRQTWRPTPSTFNIGPHYEIVNE